MAVAEEADKETVNEVSLTDYNAANFLTKEGDPCGSLYHFVINFRDFLSHHNVFLFKVKNVYIYSNQNLI